MPPISARMGYCAAVSIVPVISVWRRPKRLAKTSTSGRIKKRTACTAPRDKRQRSRDAALDKVDGVERSPALERGGEDDEMQAEEIDGAICEEGHGCPGSCEKSEKA